MPQYKHKLAHPSAGTRRAHAPDSFDPGVLLDVDARSFEELPAEPDHTDVDLVAAYRDGELPEDEAERFREHLVDCRDCADLLLLMSAQTPEEENDAESAEKTRIWRSLQDKLRLRELEKTLRRRRTDWTMAIAAAVFLVLPLGFWARTQHLIVAELSAPQLNVPFFDQSAGVRGHPSRGAAAIDATVPPGAEYFTVSFLLNRETLDDARVEILDATGRRVWSGEGLRVEDYTATLGLARRFLAAGDYTIRVFPPGSAAVPLAEVEMQIRYSETHAGEAAP